MFARLIFGPLLGFLLLGSAASAQCRTMRFGPPQMYPVAGSPSALAGGDFNADGHPDLAIGLTTTSSVALWYGTGGGFQAGPVLVGAGSPYSVAAADLNGDGVYDFLVVDAFPGNRVVAYLSEPGGSYSPGTAYALCCAPTSIIIEDFNADGQQDYAVANNGLNSVSVRLGTGGGFFGPNVEYPISGGGVCRSPVSLDAFDIGGDGILDIAVICRSSGVITILTGTGTGAFQFHSNPPGYNGGVPQWIVAADINHDGLCDLINTSFTSQDVRIHLGTGTRCNPGFGQATGFPTPAEYPEWITTGDLDGDGELDLVIGHSFDQSTLTIMRGKRDGTLEEPVPVALPAAAKATAIADFNGDGLPDIAVATPGGIAILTNQTHGCCGSADFNGDGDAGTDQDIEAFFRVLAGGNC